MNVESETYIDAFMNPGMGIRGPDTVPADETLGGERSGLGKHKCGMLEMMAVFTQETCSGTETHDLLTAHTQTFTQKK